MPRNVLAIVAIILLIPSVVAARTAPFTSSATTTAPTMYNEFTVAQLQAEMAAGRLTSVQLTQFYLDRIGALDQAGPNVNSVLELNPDALRLAQDADSRRAKGKVIGPCSSRTTSTPVTRCRRRPDRSRCSASRRSRIRRSRRTCEPPAR